MSLSVVRKHFFETVLVIGAVFVAVKVLHQFYNPDYYIFLLHPILQFLIVITILSIFITAILSYTYDQEGIKFAFGLLVFIMGAFEFAHMITHTSVHSPIGNIYTCSTHWFEIVSNLIAAAGIFFIFILKNTWLDSYKFNIKKIVTALSFFIITLIVLLLLFSKHLPVLFSENTPTTLMVTLIYIAIIFHTTNIFLSLYYIFATKKLDYIYFCNGLLLLLISNYLLLVANNHLAVEMLASHIYKAIAFFLFFQGVFLKNWDFILEHNQLDRFSRTRNMLKRKIKKARQRERKRIAQDLHDGLGQSLFLVVLKLHILRKIAPNNTVAEEIDDIEKLVKGLMVEVKEIAHTLRPSVVEEVGLVPALKTLIEQLKKVNNTDIHLSCKISNDFLNPKTETVIYRICQEAITNALKYSRANQIRVNIADNHQFTNLKISDNGIGFSQDATQVDSEMLGLNGMKERVQAVNGTFSITTELGKGTTIKVEIPKRKL